MGWKSRKTNRSGSFIKTTMNGSVFSNDSRRISTTGGPQVVTKLAETPKGARSFHRKPVSDMMTSKTPRRRNGGRELMHRSSQESFATASFQDNRFELEDGTAYSGFAQGSTTMHESNASLYGNSSFGNVDGSIPSASDFAKTMKSEMASCLEWFTREQKKLQSQQNDIAARIREGEESISTCLSKSMKEASEHGSLVVANVKENCETVEEIAKTAMIKLQDHSKQAEKSCKESYTKIERISNEAKTQVAQVKAESKLAHALYEKATTVLEAVQASADFVQSFFKKAFDGSVKRISGAMIEESDAPGVTKLSTPAKLPQDPDAKFKSSKLDTFIVIEDTSELENISPLTTKSHRPRPSKKSRQATSIKTTKQVASTKTDKPALKERTSLENLPTKSNANRPKRAAPSPNLLEKVHHVVPKTPLASISASKANAPKRRRLANTKTFSIDRVKSTLTSSLENVATKSPSMTEPSKPDVVHQSKSPKPVVRKIISSEKVGRNVIRAKPIRKNRRKKRGNVIREINFSIP